MRPGMCHAAFAMTGLLLATAYAQAVPDHIASVDVDGTDFRVRLVSGKVLSGPDLVGATLSLTQPGDAAPRKVLIKSVKIDPMDSDHEILLFHLLAVDQTTGHREELCRPDAQGERWAFPLRGQWDSEGEHISDSGFTLTCAD